MLMKLFTTERSGKRYFGVFAPFPKQGRAPFVPDTGEGTTDDPK
jgi:hypothetical protein